MPSYNIPAVTAQLKFTPAALAGIYLGHITKWNDPEIQKANPGVKLPQCRHHCCPSFRRLRHDLLLGGLLSKVSPEWKSKVGVGTSVNWPVGLGGKGNEGVSGLIRRLPNSIGYIELIYSIQNHILYGDVKNSSGNFIKASLNTVTAAAADATKTMPADFRVSITNAPGAQAYPISTYTWLLIPEKMSDQDQGCCAESFSSLELDGWPEVHDSAGVCSVARGRGAEGTAADEEAAVLANEPLAGAADEQRRVDDSRFADSIPRSG